MCLINLLSSIASSAVAVITSVSLRASCFSVASNHGRRHVLRLIGEEPNGGGGATPASSGGRLPALHAVAEHGVAEPVGQVLRESPAPSKLAFFSLDVRRVFDDSPDRAAGLFAHDAGR